jgi:hypothetical protein
MDERWDTTTVAYVLGVTVKTVYNWMKSKHDFPARGDDGKWLATDILAYAGKHHLATRRG